ncbi:metalloregulator ArsR/SmtB family transcription factor [Desulfovibrio sp. OttesenSCG-928-G15]|nr:metalloregulator ArsR/SmtB family transcription factor [Desulfovibrio sp. OttesenSCG-928-G15]
MTSSAIFPDTLQYFKALADETRLRLVNILCRYELNVNELVLIMEMGQSRISRHLKILSASGLLTFRREGLWVFYAAPSQGPAKEFLDAMLPFMEGNALFKADRDMATGMIEERVHKTRHFFNTIAEDWDKLSREVLGGFDLAGVVAENMPKCGTACDLGCGTGNVLHAMLRHADTVIGVDGSARMLELARRRFADDSNRVSLRIGELSHLPLRDAEADFATLNMVLHHVPEPVAVLREIRRIRKLSRSSWTPGRKFPGIRWSFCVKANSGLKWPMPCLPTAGRSLSAIWWNCTERQRTGILWKGVSANIPPFPTAGPCTAPVRRS